jgi:hypothetical protein
MRRLLTTAMVLVCLVSSNNLFGQTSNASVGGFVQDATRAFIPGVTVTATNTQTGVVSSAVTNESGAYNIPSLLPGTYRLSAELPGFRPHIFNDVQLGASAAGRYNFVLEVGALTDSVEVTALATQLLAETSPTIGQVLTEDRVRDLPLVSNNVLDLMRTMPGVRGGIFSSQTTFAGVGAAAVNTTRDGISVQEGRYSYGVGSTTLINPDMVGEFRVILTPVDAELGRGNGQVQIITRSGTNQFRGAGVWNIRNSALDANTWQNNRRVVRGEWDPSPGNWQNANEYSGSLGGPIIKNRTFFFALWDQNIERDRTLMRPVVLTDCARNGIFRYWEGYQNGNLNQLAANLATGNPLRASVDSFGNPVAPATNPNGTPYTGQLRHFSVFGPVTNTPTRPDCSDAVVQGAAWDQRRPAMDPAGVSQRFLEFMPRANVFDGGDGLNLAIHEWQYRGHGTGDLNTAYGTSFLADHHQINTKVDHNFNSRHKVAVNYSHQWIANDYIPVSGPTVQWPGGFLSKTVRRPRVLTTNFTSTLSSNLLNEARFGYRANWHYVWAPWEVPNEADREVPLSFMRQGSQGFPIVYSQTVNGPTGIGNMTTVSFTCATGCAQQGNNSPLFNYADTLSYTRGKHTFKGGVDVRMTYTKGFETPTAPIPKAYGGAGLNPNQAFSNNPALPGLTSNNQTTANNLLYFMAGSLDRATQYYHLYSPTDLKWGSYLDHQRKETWAHQNDFSLFFKDDWKVRPSFTLNLGVRYEFYGMPFHHSGLTPAPVGGGMALFGVSGRGFDRWMRTDNPVDLNLATQIELVGPKSPNPSRGLYKNDWNNFGPAVGFAWQLPWFGAGKTNVRGGYQITYNKPSNLAALVNSIFLNPGFSNQALTRGPADGTYFDLRNLAPEIPITPSSEPLQPIPLIRPTGDISAFDPNIVSPYIQNFTLSLTRDIARNFQVDVRYIGTRGLKLDGNFNLNTSNVYYNSRLLDALVRTRAGENVDLFDQIFMGLNINGNSRGCDPSNPTAVCAPVNGTTQRGSAHLRLSTTFRDDLANGNFQELTDDLNIYNGAGSSAVPGIPGEQGTVLTRANRGFNVPGGTTVAGAPAVPAGLFPSNWITANPQFDDVNYYTNTGKSNYHSLQLQGTLRPVAGLGVQGTYVWSRAMALSAGTYTNPLERDRDYGLSGSHITHDFRANGTFDLPFGPNRLLFRNSSGWVARTLEGWQTSFILNLNSGTPASIVAGNMLYGNGVPDVVGPFDAKPFGKVKWEGQSGNYFGADTYRQVSDPQCGAVASTLQPYCTLQAISDASGKILLQNPQPGMRGTLGRNTMENPGQWALDAAMSKTIRVTETKSFVLRMDATNILNHPTPNNPNFDINDGTDPFGFINDKGNQRRQFKGMLRFNF